MSTRIFLSFANLLIVLSCSGLFAQEGNRPNRNAQADTLASKIKLEKAPKEQLWDNLTWLQLRAGTDLSKLIVNAFSPDDLLLEANTEWVLGNHFFVPIDFGYSRYSRSDELNTFLYQSKGTYLRAGLGANLLFRQSDKYAVSVGLNFASASYQHSLSTEITDNYWGVVSRDVSEGNLRARWAEFVFGFKVPVFKNFYINSNVRFKFLGTTGASNALSGSQLPGYGSGLNTNTFELNYSLLYRIPIFDFKETLKKKVTEKIEENGPEK